MFVRIRARGRALFVCGSLVVLAGCSRQGPLAGASAPADDHHSVQVTVWEAGLELFVEYAVPEAGQPVQLITHVTHTATGEPQRAGAATFTLRSAAGQTLTHVEPAPARAGIYLPELVFPAGGTWEVSLGLERLAPDTGEAVVTLPPIEVAGSHDQAHAFAIPEPPDGIAFLKEQQRRMGTRIAPLVRRPLTDRFSVPAVVRAAAERRAEVTPPVAGRLETPGSGVLPHIGDRVSAGDVMAFVRPPFSDYLSRVQQSEADIVRTRLSAERARSRFERIEALAAQNARSERELEESGFALQIAEAEHAAAVAVAEALKASGVVASKQSGVRFELRAPISGIVREVSAVNGTYVPVGTPVFRIQDSSFVHLEALVRPEDLTRISARDRVVVVRARGSDGPRELTLPDAELVYVGDEVDPHTLAVPVHFEVPNPDLRLRIAERVEVQLPAREPSLELALPLGAIVEENGEPTVFVQLGGETFEKRYVQLGFRDGRTVQILSGVEAGEQVVVEGGYAVRLASLSDSAPSHGHSH